MKYKHLIVCLLALSLLAIAFVSTVAAAELSSYTNVTKNGKYLTFSIWTTGYKPPDYFFGTDVDPSSLELHITDTKGNPEIVFPVDLSIVDLSTDYVTFTMARQDLPVGHATSFYITGSIVSGPSAGSTFTAAGPGWGWGNVH